jgi:PadR family transcriptional regulator PadR
MPHHRRATSVNASAAASIFGASPGPRRAIIAPVPGRARDTSRAAAEAATRPGPMDPLVGDLRRAGLLPLLVLHYVAREPSYGNQLIDRIEELTGGALTVNPNTMYPLLRSLEERGLVAGQWEQPDRRSRRFYRITSEGEAERARLAAELEPRMQRIAQSIRAIRREVLT